MNLAMIGVYLGKSDVVERTLPMLEAEVGDSVSLVSQNYPRLASAFASVKNFEKAAYFYQKLVHFNQGNIENLIGLAYSHAKIGKVKTVILATNIPVNMKRDVNHYAALGGIEVVAFEGDAIRLGQVCGKPFKILAVGIQ